MMKEETRQQILKKARENCRYESGVDTVGFIYLSQLEEILNEAGAEWMQGEWERQWISVKDRLPYKDGDSQIFCLVWDTYEGHAVVRPYNEYHKCWDGEDADDFYTDATEGNITHWMPLPPAPPKPQNNENL